MAEGFPGARGINSSSTGSMSVPSGPMNRLAVEVMSEKGIDVSGAKPKAITEQMVNDADVVGLTGSTLENSIRKNIRKKFRKKLVVWSQILQDNQ